MDKSLNIALIGASGVVGEKILKILEKKDIHFENLFPLGKSTVGNSIHFQNEYLFFQEFLKFFHQQHQRHRLVQY